MEERNLKRIAVSVEQAGISVLLITIGTVFFPVAGIVVPIAGVTGWVAVLAAFVLSLPWALMAARLAQHVKANDWSDAVMKWLGPWLGRLFLLYFAGIWAVLGGTLLLQTGVVFNNLALPSTPTMVLTATMLAVVFFTSLRGIEVYLRTLQVLVVMLLPLALGLAVITFGSIRISNLQPIWGFSSSLLAHAAYLSLPWPMEGILYSLFIGTMVKGKEKLALYNGAAIFTAGVLLAVVVVVNLAVLGRGVVESYIYPTIALARVEPSGGILSGSEIFLFPLWIIASYIKISASFIMVVASLQGLFRFIKPTYLSIGVAGIFMAITFVPRNAMEMVALIARVDNTFFLLGYLIIPLVLLVTSIKCKEKHRAGA